MKLPSFILGVILAAAFQVTSAQEPQGAARTDPETAKMEQELMAIQPLVVRGDWRGAVKSADALLAKVRARYNDPQTFYYSSSSSLEALTNMLL